MVHHVTNHVAMTKWVQNTITAIHVKMNAQLSNKSGIKPDAMQRALLFNGLRLDNH